MSQGLNWNKKSWCYGDQRDHYGEWASVATGLRKSQKQWLKHPEKDKWKNAMDKEMESLYKNVWNWLNCQKSKGCWKQVGS